MRANEVFEAISKFGPVLRNVPMVKYTLGDKAKQIFASKYQFHLPTEAELEAEIKREIKEIQYRLKFEKNENPENFNN